LDSLGLVKIFIFDLMKYHFDFKEFPGVSYKIPENTEPEDYEYERSCIELLKDLESCLDSFQVKLSAAYARLRIEHKAGGSSFRQQMENILPESVREREEMAGTILLTSC
jgi:hypothetical protein